MSKDQRIRELESALCLLLIVANQTVPILFENDMDLEGDDLAEAIHETEVVLHGKG